MVDGSPAIVSGGTGGAAVPAAAAAARAGAAAAGPRLQRRCRAGTSPICSPLTTPPPRRRRAMAEGPTPRALALSAQKRRRPMLVVASLVDKAPNAAVWCAPCRGAPLRGRSPSPTAASSPARPSARRAWVPSGGSRSKRWGGRRCSSTCDRGGRAAGRASASNRRAARRRAPVLVPGEDAAPPRRGEGRCAARASAEVDACVEIPQAGADPLAQRARLGVASDVGVLPPASDLTIEIIGAEKFGRVTTRLRGRPGGGLARRSAAIVAAAAPAVRHPAATARRRLRR